MARLGIVTALAPEAAIARRAVDAARDPKSAPIVGLSGPGPDRASRAAHALLARGADALLSLGVAGGLDPFLDPGTVVIADRLLSPGGAVLSSDGNWRHRLLDTVSGRIVAVTGDIAGTDRPLRTAPEKAALFEASGASVVDMESFAVARVAHEAGVPFLAVRSVADPARRTVPMAALGVLDQDGAVHPIRALVGLMANPAEFLDFMRVAMDGRAAFGALGRVASLAPRFGLI